MDLMYKIYHGPFTEIDSYVTTTATWYNAPFTGFYYMFCSSHTSGASPFIRIGTQNAGALKSNAPYYFEGHGPSGNYSYLTSPIIFIKKGELMISQGCSVANSVNYLFVNKFE